MSPTGIVLQHIRGPALLGQLAQLLAAGASAHALTSGGAALSSAKGLVRAWGGTATAALVATVAATAVAVRARRQAPLIVRPP
jgi:hypothetical protein